MKDLKYTKAENDRDVVVSTRVRIARNLSKTPFPAKLNGKGLEDVCGKVKKALDKSDYTFVDPAALSDAERQSYVEARSVSPEFISSPKGRLLVTGKKDPHVFIMVNEEDHIRLQSFFDGFAPDEAYRSALDAEADLEKGLAAENESFAFDDAFGYLTRCPTNVGCGMRISVMLHLPALTGASKINSLAGALGRLDCNLRGSYGEGSESVGALYQVSNRTSAGKTEEEIMKDFRKVVGEIVEAERKERESMLKNAGAPLRDKIMRAYGTMKYAARISSKELLELYTYVRLGKSLGFDFMPDYGVIDRSVTELMPAHLLLSDMEADDPYKRDEIRADRLRELIG